MFHLHVTSFSTPPIHTPTHKPPTHTQIHPPHAHTYPHTLHPLRPPFLHPVSSPSLSPSFPLLPEAFNPFMNVSRVSIPSWLPSKRRNRSATLNFCWSTQLRKRFLHASKLKLLARAISLSLVRASSSCRWRSDERSQSFCQRLYKLEIFLVISGLAWGLAALRFLATLLRASMLGCCVAMSSWKAGRPGKHQECKDDKL